jgi:hypothetical protein
VSLRHVLIFWRAIFAAVRASRAVMHSSATGSVGSASAARWLPTVLEQGGCFVPLLLLWPLVVPPSVAFDSLSTCPPGMALRSTPHPSLSHTHTTHTWTFPARRIPALPSLFNPSALDPPSPPFLPVEIRPIPRLPDLYQTSCAGYLGSRARGPRQSKRGIARTAAGTQVVRRSAERTDEKSVRAWWVR